MNPFTGTRRDVARQACKLFQVLYLCRATVLLLLIAFTAPPSRAQQWVLLGARSVTDRLDHDTIPVTISRGDFERLKMVVQNAAVDFHRVVIHFAKLADQEVVLRERIPARGESRVIDLRGGERVIRSIDLWYDTASLVGRHAVVQVFAKR